MELKLENGYYVDNNNNKWNAKAYNENEALQHSKGLVNCFDCVDCINCKDCRACINCFECVDCVDCDTCDNTKHSKLSNHLSDCEFCINKHHLDKEYKYNDLLHKQYNGILKQDKGVCND